MESPTTRYIIRLLLAGILASAGALKAYLPGLSVDDWLSVIVTGIIASGSWAGLEYATPLNPLIGKNKTAK